MPKELSRIFLDANVWFSAARSKTGGSFYILTLARAGLVQIYTNQHTLEEVERNLLLKSTPHLSIYHKLIQSIGPIVTNTIVTKKFQQLLMPLMPAEDIPIIAGAMTAKVKYLISLDKRHLVNERVRNLELPFQILMPGEFLEIFRRLYQNQTSNK